MSFSKATVLLALLAVTAGCTDMSQAGFDPSKTPFIACFVDGKTGMASADFEDTVCNAAATAIGGQRVGKVDTDMLSALPGDSLVVRVGVTVVSDRTVRFRIESGTAEGWLRRAQTVNPEMSIDVMDANIDNAVPGHLAHEIRRQLGL